jgi:preprotein translocase subunit SecE
MSSKRRSATKQRNTVPASTSASAVSAETPKPTTPPKTQKPKETAPTESRFRTFWDKLMTYFRNTWAEIKKVTWPDWETTRNLTVLVIVMAVFLGVLLGGIDFVLLKIFEAF